MQNIRKRAYEKKILRYLIHIKNIYQYDDLNKMYKKKSTFLLKIK